MTGMEGAVLSRHRIYRLHGGTVEDSVCRSLVLPQCYRTFVPFHLVDTQLRTLLCQTETRLDAGAVSLCRMDPCRRVHLASR